MGVLLASVTIYISLEYIITIMLSYLLSRVAAAPHIDSVEWVVESHCPGCSHSLPAAPSLFWC